MVSKTGLALVAALMGIGIAQAQTAPPAPDAGAAASETKKRVPKKKKQAAKNATEVVFVNGRQAVVTGATVISAAGKTVATLKRPLEPGKRAAFKLPKGAGCTFGINASFSDDAEFDQTDVNLCADKTVKFTD